MMLKKACLDRFTMADMGDVGPMVGMAVITTCEEGTLTTPTRECVRNIFQNRLSYGVLNGLPEEHPEVQHTGVQT